MKSSLLPRLLLLGGLACCLLQGRLEGAPSTRPSILLLFADDLGYDKIGCYGGLEVPTPNIDSLANQGIRCSRAYTSPVCTPSRMSLLTGLYAVNHGFTSVLPVHLGTRKKVDFSRYATLPRALKEAGYHTAVTGKWQLATLEFHPDHILSAGFDSWCVWQIWKEGKKTTRYWDPCFNHDGMIRQDIQERYGPDVLADYVIAQMKQSRDAGRPFYIQHNILLPHWPILETPLNRAEGSQASLDHMITYLDGIVGRLVQAVDDLGLGDRTWIVFMGDNGTDSKIARRTLQGAVSGGKNSLTDGGMHVPLIFRTPNQQGAGAVLHDLIDIVDLFPTFLELAGSPVPASLALDGKSFAAKLLGKEGAPHRNFVTAGLHGADCVFDGTWRLTRGAKQIVDCSGLPVERAVDPGSPEARAAMERLSRILESVARR